MTALRSLRYLVPTAITFTGYVLGLLGVAAGVANGYGLLLASGACDMVDGTSARLLDATSRIGAEIDLTVDTLLAHGLVWVTLPREMSPWISILLIAWAAFARQVLHRPRTSGRLLAWGACFLWVFAAGHPGTPIMEGL